MCVCDLRVSKNTGTMEKINCAKEEKIKFMW